jgi:hypothetical protein
MRGRPQSYPPSPPQSPLLPHVAAPHSAPASPHRSSTPCFPLRTAPLGGLRLAPARPLCLAPCGSMLHFLPPPSTAVGRVLGCHPAGARWARARGFSPRLPCAPTRDHCDRLVNRSHYLSRDDVQHPYVNPDWMIALDVQAKSQPMRRILAHVNDQGPCLQVHP